MLNVLLPGPQSGDASSIWEETVEQGQELICPPLLFAEVTSMLRVFTFDGRIKHGEAGETLRLLMEIPIRIVNSERIYLRALDMASHLEVKRAYDVQYIAAAELEGAVLVTADMGQFSCAERLGVRARLAR